MSAVRFPAISGPSDVRWQQAILRGRAEGNAVLAQIRVRLSRREEATTQVERPTGGACRPGVISLGGHHALNNEKYPAPCSRGVGSHDSNFTVAGSLAGERSAGDRLTIAPVEASDGEPINREPSVSKANERGAGACENQRRNHLPYSRGHKPRGSRAGDDECDVGRTQARVLPRENF